MFGHVSLRSAISVSNNSFIMIVNILIILAKFVTYRSQYNASIIGSGLPSVHNLLSIKLHIRSYIVTL